MLKSLELIFRRLVLQSLRRKNRTDKPQPPLMDLPPNPKILFLRHDKIGDAIITIPSIRILRHHFETAQIDVLLGSKNIAASSAVLHYINKIWEYTKKTFGTIKLLNNIRAEHYDVIIDCMDNPSTTSRLIIRLANAKYSVGLENTPGGFYTHSIPIPDKTTTHIVERTAKMLTVFGINPKPSELYLEYPIPLQYKNAAETAFGSKTNIRLGINIAAGWGKYWGRENFIKLIQQINSEEIEIIGFASKAFQHELIAISAATELISAPLTSNFDEFAALLSSSDVILTPDTSVVHLAAAWKIPCVVLYAGIVDNLMLWTPYRSPHRVLSTREQLLSVIHPEKVLEALNELTVDIKKQA
ncbi:MAG: glycosyltransferase family 9 protein [Ignavibacteriae bacterium]|nr:glycosyltransferase family 9 protein [Ignavibacteriota bacterium]